MKTRNSPARGSGLKQASSDTTERAIRESARVVESLLCHVPQIDAISKALVAVLKTGGKVLTAGNGGSAAEALHMAEELTGRFRSNRLSLPAVPLVADPCLLTCIGNDFGFDELFSRQVEALGNPGDLLVLFSTSGNAENLKRAHLAACKSGLITVCLLGRDGGRLAGRGDYEVIVRGNSTERIQEAHTVIVHLLLEAVETAFAGVRRRKRS